MSGRDDPGAGSTEEPERPWTPPPVRVEALVATWSLLLGGHVLGLALAAWALTTPVTNRSPSRAGLLLALLALGAGGAALATYGLRVVLAIRRSAARALPATAPAGPPTNGPSTLVLACLLVLAAVVIAVIALLVWRSPTVLPAVAGEFVFIPLAMRTAQYGADVAAELTSPDGPS